MPHGDETTQDKQVDDFIKSAEQPRQGLTREISRFLRAERNWILLPIIMMLLLFGVMVILSSGVAAPLIYTLF